MFSLFAFFSLVSLYHYDALLVEGLVTSSSLPPVKPVKIPFDTFFKKDSVYPSDRDPLLRALQEVGMVSITHVPHMKELKNQALSWDLHLCAQESLAAESHKYPDGTVRRTLATHTIPGGSPTNHIEHHYDDMNYDSSAPCHKFDDVIAPFRAAVDDVTRAFADRLSLLMQDDVTMPLLMTADKFPFSTVAEIVEYGEHLEHFHSYQHLDGSINDFAHTVEEVHPEPRTMDFHLDQGMFLVFAPGRMTTQDLSQPTSLSTGFLVELPGGNPAQVDFDDEDDLVILLGDGVNQYVNPHLADGLALRAMPHALALPNHSPDSARVWYGRMVLPPALAVHPQHGKTFAELRRNLIRASTDAEGKDLNVLSLGCASTSHVARQLEEMSCSAETLMCWHKCMSLEEYNVSDDICSSEGKEVFCINPRGQLWDGNHGDFYPGCATNDTEIATPYPTLPDYPRDENTCTNASFAEFASSMPYENEINLGAGGAIFKWNVSDGHVHGRMIFNGLLGFLAFGLANVGGEKNGMHGANIIMAIPGGNYSAITGFDLSIDPSVQQFQISTNPEQSAFRFWGVDDGVTAEARHEVLELDITDCFSSFTFETSTINGVSLNLEGVDQLLWSANDVDSFAGYHGMNRGRFSIDWSTGEAKLFQADGESTTAPDNSGSFAERVGIMVPLVLLLFSLVIQH